MGLAGVIRLIRLIGCGGWLLVPLGGCRAPSADTPRPPVVAAAVPATTPAEGVVGHGSHDPKHGGVVLMYSDLHYEVVLDLAGRHRIYFSDVARADLPAATASQVFITIRRPGEPDELLPLAIDEEGESWVAAGKPVRTGGASARVGLRVRGEPWWTDLPVPDPAPSRDRR